MATDVKARKREEIFTKLDTNKDGTIDENDIREHITHFLSKYNIAADSPQARKALDTAKQIWQKLSSGGKGSAITKETVALPDTISVLVLFGVLGYLDPDERRALWDRALPRLAPGAPVAVELLPIARPAPLARMNLARERIGELTYEAWMTGEPVGGDIMRLTSTWTVSGAATEPRVVRNTSEWHTFGVENLAEETGLAVERVAGHIGVLRAPGPTRTPAE